MSIKGVIVAAGYGTRFLPVTRCIPKEMLPIVDRPSLDLVVDEMHQAGVERILVITSRRKRALEDWFDRDPELDAALEGRADLRSKLEPPPVEVVFARQRQMTGAGDALLLARDFVGQDPALVAYPDDLFGRPNCSAALVEAWRQTGCSVLAAQELERQEDLQRYGVLDVRDEGTVWRVRGMVEKPTLERAPSRVVSWGRYLLLPEFFEALARLRPADLEGEYTHAGALADLAAKGRLVAQPIQAPRHDTGTPLGFLKATIELALQRDDVGPELARWLEDRLRKGS